MQESRGDRVFVGIIVAFCVLAVMITLYPFIYVLSMSVSEPIHVISQRVWLYPMGFQLGGYRLVFQNPEIWRSYYNTVWYATVGTVLNVSMTLLGGYAVSRPRFFLRNYIMFFISFTMFFSGGLIPLFILVRRLGLYNTRLALILPTAVSAWYIIIARTFFRSTIHESLHESAIIDGAGELRILMQIVIPLSKPIIAVLSLFYAVGHWNAYFGALIFLPSKALQPLQLYLVRVLLQASEELLGSMDTGLSRTSFAVQLRYATIIVAVLPIVCVYPFLQRYFVKGVMIGAIKG